MWFILHINMELIDHITNLHSGRAHWRVILPCNKFAKKNVELSSPAAVGNPFYGNLEELMKWNGIMILLLRISRIRAGEVFTDQYFTQGLIFESGCCRGGVGGSH